MPGARCGDGGDSVGVCLSHGADLSRPRAVLGAPRTSARRPSATIAAPEKLAFDRFALTKLIVDVMSEEEPFAASEAVAKLASDRAAPSKSMLAMSAVVASEAFSKLAPVRSAKAKMIRASE